MNYLEPSEYQVYGLETTTELAWVTAASAIVDAHCRRATLAVAQYLERMRVQAGRAARLTYLPLAVVAPATSAIVSARARYGPARHGEMTYDELAADAERVFGIAGAWADLNIADLDVVAETGEVTPLQNVFGWTFNEMEFVYTAGLDPIPSGVKVACAQIVKNAQATPALNVKQGMLDRMRLLYFSDSLVDATVKALLAPYVAQKVG